MSRPEESGQTASRGTFEIVDTGRQDVTSLEPGNGATDAIELRFDSRSVGRTVFIVCASLELAFVLLDYHVNYGRLTDIGALRRLTNIAREDGLASWFASTQTLLVGLTAWGLWILARARGGAVWRRAGWLLVALLFTYMAVDDGAQLHERFATVFDTWRTRGGGPAGRFPSYTWQLLFVPVFGGLGALTCLFLWLELGSRRARLLLVAAFLLFGAAVVLDFLEGLESDHPWNLYAGIVARYDLRGFTEARFAQPPYEALLHFSRSFEEWLEMLANTCLWTAVLGGAGVVATDVRLRTTG
jgi:hypothetical protein